MSSVLDALRRGRDQKAPSRRDSESAESDAVLRSLGCARAGPPVPTAPPRLPQLRHLILYVVFAAIVWAVLARF